jgi:hypothetical protein
MTWRVALRESSGSGGGAQDRADLEPRGDWAVPDAEPVEPAGGAGVVAAALRDQPSVGLINLQKKLEWYQRYRESLLERLVPMEGRWRMTGRARVGSKRYLAELLLSRVVVSPFGWGEVCFRDYEAVAAGCLLVKPSMDHVRTQPDIYRAGQTYVSVRWGPGGSRGEAGALSEPAARGAGDCASGAAGAVGLRRAGRRGGSDAADL